MAGRADRTAPVASPVERPEGVGGYDVFVSYSRVDAAFVAKLAGRLDGVGKRVWLDSSSIPPGTAWSDEVSGGIDAADSFLLVISPDSVASSYCRDELAHALGQGKRVIPIVYREADGVPTELAARQFVDMQAEDAFETGLAALVGALETDLEWARAHTRWLEEAQRWEEQGRDRGLLLHGADLATAERWLAGQSERKEPRPTALQSQFIALSRERATRRLRLTLGAVAAGGAVAVALGVLALVQRQAAVHERDLARSREFAATAESLVETEPRRAIWFALRGVEIEPTAQAEVALRRAMLSRLRVVVLKSRFNRNVSLAFTRDGKRLASAGEDGGVTVWDVAKRKRVAELGWDGLGIAFTPDERGLVFGQAEALWLWDFSRKKRPRMLRAGDVLVAVGFTPDGKLVSSSWGAQIDVRGLAARKPSARFWTRQYFIGWPDLSADGKRIVVPGAEGSVQVWSLMPHKRLALLLGHSGSVRSAAFSADGRLVVSTGEDSTVRVWDWANGRSLAVLRGHSGTTQNATFSPDGERVVSTSSDGTVRVWTWENGVSVKLTGHEGDVSDVAFSPDGGRFATVGERTIRLWTCEACGPLGDLVAHARRAVPTEPPPPKIEGEVVTPIPAG